jgi:hypothetical protein
LKLSNRASRKPLNSFVSGTKFLTANLTVTGLDRRGLRTRGRNKTPRFQQDWTRAADAFPTTFHVGNTGSNPVGEANSLVVLVRDWSPHLGCVHQSGCLVRTACKYQFFRWLLELSPREPCIVSRSARYVLIKPTKPKDLYEGIKRPTAVYIQSLGEGPRTFSHGGLPGHPPGLTAVFPPNGGGGT